MIEDYNALEVERENISEKALVFLKEKANEHSKVRNDIYTDMKGKEYFYNQKITPDLAQILFKFRTRMFNVKNNFRNKYKQSNIRCPLCNDNDDTQEHLFNCKTINKQEFKILNSKSFLNTFSEGIDYTIYINIDIDDPIYRHNKEIKKLEL